MKQKIINAKIYTIRGRIFQEYQVITACMKSKHDTRGSATHHLSLFLPPLSLSSFCILSIILFIRVWWIWYAIATTFGNFRQFPAFFLKDLLKYIYIFFIIIHWELDRSNELYRWQCAWSWHQPRIIVATIRVILGVEEVVIPWRPIIPWRHPIIQWRHPIIQAFGNLEVTKDVFFHHDRHLQLTMLFLHLQINEQ